MRSENNSSERSADEERDIQQRIAQLTVHLLQKIEQVNVTHRSHLQSLAVECNHAIQELSTIFNERLDVAQQYHEQIVAGINEELRYLRELSESQHLMLQNNIEYIKNLEQRLAHDPKAREA